MITRKEIEKGALVASVIIGVFGAALHPPSSFVVIPAGVPHFVATKEGPVIVQLSGTGIFRSDFLEK